MIIYLCIKTHRHTGYKYLCQTVQEPFKYKGSGPYWRSHLKRYGNTVHTEIARECQSKEELSYWGRYYSKLWRITTSMDDYGNRIWANQIPETGGGPGGGIKQTSEVIMKANNTKIVNNSGPGNPEIIAKVRATKLANNTGMNNPEISAKRELTKKINGTENKGLTHGRYDHSLYSWKNLSTGEVVHMTQYMFCKTYNLSTQTINSAIHRGSKTTMGWKLM